ncbi:MAG: peptide ABC transporter substrate-binding protein [Gemmatimonadaceae bacterium]
MNLARFSVILASCSAIVACGSGDKRSDANAPQVGGTLVIASGYDADALLPPIIISAGGKAAADMLFEQLAMIDDELHFIGDKTFTPRLSDRWEWSKDSLSIAFHIDPRAKWQDGKPVVAADVKFTFDLIRNPAAASIIASSLTNVDSVSVRDSSVAVAWFHARTPDQFYEVAYNLIPIPQHVYGGIKAEDLKNSPAANAPIGNGRFRFVRWEKNSTLELVADTTSWRGRPKLDRLIWTIRSDPNAAMASVLSGESDFIEVLRGDAIKQIAASTVARAVIRPAFDMTTLVFHVRGGAKGEQPHAVLGDRDVRRALAMAVDRVALTRNLLDTLGLPAIGPLPRHVSASDSTVPQIPFDVEGARKLLDAAGWKDANGDGIREKKGKPLQFSVMTPSSSTVRVRAATLLQSMWKEVGAKVDIAAIEGNTMQGTVRSGKFDAALINSTSDPVPAGLSQNWGSDAARTGKGFNIAMYMNPKFDATLDSAQREFDQSKANKYYRNASEILINDAPAIFLFEPTGTGAINKRIRPAPMRADFWWAHLDEWTIDPAMALPRDKIGLRQAKP